MTRSTSSLISKLESEGHVFRSLIMEDFVANKSLPQNYQKQAKALLKRLEDNPKLEMGVGTVRVIEEGSGREINDYSYYLGACYDGSLMPGHKFEILDKDYLPKFEAIQSFNTSLAVKRGIVIPVSYRIVNLKGNHDEDLRTYFAVNNEAKTEKGSAMEMLDIFSSIDSTARRPAARTLVYRNFRKDCVQHFTYTMYGRKEYENKDVRTALALCGWITDAKVEEFKNDQFTGVDASQFQALTARFKEIVDKLETVAGDYIKYTNSKFMVGLAKFLYKKNLAGVTINVDAFVSYLKNNADQAMKDHLVDDYGNVVYGSSYPGFYTRIHCGKIEAVYAEIEPNLP